MFSAVLFTIPKTWKQFKCPLTGEWISKMQNNTQTMEYYSALKKNGILPFMIRSMGLESIMLSEIIQRNTNTV